MSSSIEKYIEELRHTATTAQLNYEIWWAYKNKENRPKYINTMNKYSLFFQTSIHAHFVALLIALYSLYEVRNDTYNIPTLLRRLRNEGAIPVEALDELDKLYAAAKPLWIKVNILRNKAFGHRSVAHTPKEVFAEAKVTPNELRELVDTTKKLLNQLTKAWNKSVHAFNLSACRDLLAMLNDLDKLKKG